MKTSLSVGICLILSELFSYPVVPINACFAAVLSMGDTVRNSIRSGVMRVVATAIGGMMAILTLFIDLGRLNPYLEIIVVMLACAATLYVCILLGIPETAGLACVVFLVIVLSHPENKYWFAGIRLLETIAGILISLAVNRLIRPSGAEPDPEPD